MCIFGKISEKVYLKFLDSRTNIYLFEMFKPLGIEIHSNFKDSTRWFILFGDCFAITYPS